MNRSAFSTLCVIVVGCRLAGIGCSDDDFGGGVAELVKESDANQVELVSKTSASVGYPTFVSPQTFPIVLEGDRLFVVNTPADTVDVIDAKSHELQWRIKVGVDPVSIAARPDGKEVWVSNHISDSVSVIDTDRESPTHMQVIETIQVLNTQSRATRFDEPMGIAFAGNTKAYVALSSTNEIAVIDVPTRSLEKRLKVAAQDPRSLVVRNGFLYVIPFESNNQTQLSGGTGELDGELVTFNAYEHSIANNNVLSIGAVLDIVKHPRVPDRDLFIFDTETDELVETVDTVGTLLYGIAVNSKGRVFVAQTDARNEVNGRSGTQKHGLAELENRAFLNRISAVLPGSVRRASKPDSSDVALQDRSDWDAEVEFIDLEPLPPRHPDPSEAFATPFAIQVSEDDSVLVATAAGSDKLFTVDATSGDVLGWVKVDSVPRGIALSCDQDGHPSQAWVFNAVANSVSIVDVSSPSNPVVEDTIALHDPTHAAVKRGRIAFNTAAASTTKTFSCASCHPDGHTDQLLWVLKTPVVTGGNQIMPRSTMPLRGLRDTAPFHWDGIPGDPYGGNNSANVHGSDPPNSDPAVPASTTRHLIDGGMAGTMSMVGDSTVNDEGKAGALTAAERDDMATFLLSVPYPPAQRRAYTNELSDRAKQGFRLFHIDGDHQGKQSPNVCGDCHRMPFWVSTNTPGTGMDAPTWRGANDRFLILPQGRLNIIDFDFYRAIAEQGIPERSMWQVSWAGRRRFDPVWDMVLEGSTGYSGSFARQITIKQKNATDKLTTDLLKALELSAAEGGVILQGEGVLMDASGLTPVALQFDFQPNGGRYVTRDTDQSYSRTQLLAFAAEGKFIGTFSARHGVNADVDHPQPALWTRGPIEQQRGRQRFPVLHKGNQRLRLSGRHFQEDANLIVDGRRVAGKIMIEHEAVDITLAELPGIGMHFLQVQVPGGLFSNDFIFQVTSDAKAAGKLRRQLGHVDVEHRSDLGNAVVNGEVQKVKQLLDSGVAINQRDPSDGITALSNAVLHGHAEIARLLIGRGADVEAANRDGNTPLHIAAFTCRFEIVRLLLEEGASPKTKNGRGETASDVVSSPWSEPLAGFYAAIGKGIGIDVDPQRLKRDRARMVELFKSTP